MYKQTDPKIARFVDYKNVIEKYGCLFTSLLYLVERATKKTFLSEQVKLVYDYCVAKGHMKYDCWINDHTEIIKAGLRCLGVEYKSVKYLAKKGHHGEDTWGYLTGYTDMLIQVKTVNGNGHFKHHDWDPYEPSPESQYIMSERYYQIVLTKETL